MMSTERAVVSDRLRVVRGGRNALDDFTATVRAGCVTGLLGPNGSGKSTLMRSIVGVQVIASGALSVLDLPAGSPRLRAQIGYMTQAPSVYGDLTVEENLLYFARVLGVPRRRVDEVVEEVHLTAEQGRPVDRLSGGQRARVSLAAALIGQPRLLALDEPTVGLDPVLRKELWELFHTIAGGGATVLVSSHVMDEARHCDELLLLHEGRQLASGSPQELRERTGADDLEDGFLRLIEEART
jgi:ABC-2 type transport system ATP-binding protein